MYKNYKNFFEAITQNGIQKHKSLKIREEKATF